MLKPILHTLATNLNDPDAITIPYVFATESIRQIGDTYNWLLKSEELPSRRYIQHVKVCWAMECALRVQGSSASKMYNAAVFGHLGFVYVFVVSLAYPPNFRGLYQ
jgi:hypothetical protein